MRVRAPQALNCFSPSMQRLIRVRRPRSTSFSLHRVSLSAPIVLLLHCATRYTCRARPQLIYSFCALQFRAIPSCMETVSAPSRKIHFGRSARSTIRQRGLWCHIWLWCTIWCTIFYFARCQHDESEQEEHDVVKRDCHDERSIDCDRVREVRRHHRRPCVLCIPRLVLSSAV